MKEPKRENEKTGLEQWSKALFSASKIIVTDNPEPGFFTVRQVAEQTGQSVETTGRKMRLLVKQGLAEIKTFRILVGSFRSYPVEHYRLKNPQSLDR